MLENVFCNLFPAKDESNMTVTEQVKMCCILSTYIITFKSVENQEYTFLNTLLSMQTDTVEVVANRQLAAMASLVLPTIDLRGINEA